MQAHTSTAGTTAGLYIHIPFCEKRCSYCDFYTVANRQQALPAYIQALLDEIALYSAIPFWQTRVFSTVYFGGGTPSLLSPAQVRSILDHVRRHFRIAAAAEITVEANPGTVSAAALQGYVSAGVNRLSLGAQSFWPDELVEVERLHSVEDIYKTVEDARAAGFTNLSLDLIFALPGQRPYRWRHNLEQAIHLQPEHISVYNLSIEEGTPLYKSLQKGKIRPLSEGKARVIFNFTIEFLQAHGYRQYEVSNYARPGFYCRHNTGYWDGSPYLGLGASAHSYDGRRRFWNVPNYVHYIEKVRNGFPAVHGEELLTPSQQRFEMIFLGLRRSEGLNLQEYARRFGRPFEQDYAAVLKKLAAHEPPLFTIDNGHLRLTREGLFLCDAVSSEFLIEAGTADAGSPACSRSRPGVTSTDAKTYLTPNF